MFKRVAFCVVLILLSINLLTLMADDADSNIAGDGDFVAGTSEGKAVRGICENSNTSAYGASLAARVCTGFHASDLRLLSEEPVQINDIYVVPACPKPYVHMDHVRVNEPVLIKVNVTGVVYEVLLRFRILNEQWFNVTMELDAEGLWVQTIPGQSSNCTMEFFIEAFDAYGVCAASPAYAFYVKSLLAGDINGDDVVDIFDLAIVAVHFSETNP